jgi:hypothetical protein
VHASHAEGETIWPEGVEAALEMAGVEFDPGYGAAIIAMFDTSGSGGPNQRRRRHSAAILFAPAVSIVPCGK